MSDICLTNPLASGQRMQRAYLVYMRKRHAIAFLLVILILFVAIIVAVNHTSSPNKPTGHTLEEVTLVQQKKIKVTLAQRAKELGNLPAQERQQFLASEAARLERVAAKVEEETLGKSQP